MADRGSVPPFYRTASHGDENLRFYLSLTTGIGERLSSGGCKSGQAIPDNG